jgi:hypothetical protein
MFIQEMKMCGNQKEPFPRFPNAFPLLEIKPTNNEIHNITIVGLQQLGNFGVFYLFGVAHNTIYKLYYKQKSDGSSQVYVIVCIVNVYCKQNCNALWVFMCKQMNGSLESTNLSN